MSWECADGKHTEDKPPREVYIGVSLAIAFIVSLPLLIGIYVILWALHLVGG